MKLNENSSKPLFLQIAEIIEDMIIDGDLKGEDQVFSTNQLSETFKINPATARKGLNLLVEKGILFKKRGLGMFVEKGAEKIIQSERKSHFFENFILVMLKEAEKLSISEEEIIKMIKKQEEGE
ncbi:MAG TPA: GntR family transcriptional regulator [Thermotogota bacterium]|nr:GntR family transcriptional regulator [Thermotogota bacterium]HPR94694.1 GntR family transcriptional regulator [Thermotogota bacterium]